MPRGWTSCRAAISCTVRSLATPRAPPASLSDCPKAGPPQRELALDHQPGRRRADALPPARRRRRGLERADPVRDHRDERCGGRERPRARSRPSPSRVRSWGGPRAPGAVRGARREMLAETIDAETIKVKSAAAQNGPPEPLIRAGPWGGKRDRGPASADEGHCHRLRPKRVTRGSRPLLAGYGRQYRSAIDHGPDSTSHTDTATDDPDDPAPLCPCTASVAQEESARLRVARRVSPATTTWPPVPVERRACDTRATRALRRARGRKR